MELVVDGDHVAPDVTVRANPSARRADPLQPGRQLGQIRGGRRRQADSPGPSSATTARSTFESAITATGVALPMSRRLFRSFSKSAQEAAHSAPGVGLGLALSRRLAHDMGGKLALDKDVTDGACFVLTLDVTK